VNSLKKLINPMVILVILIICAPLVGYFGTKYVILSMEDTKTAVEENIDSEDIPEKEELIVDNQDEINNVSIELKELSIPMIQFASFNSSSAADTYISNNKSENIASFKVAKDDGSYKVMYTAFFDKDNIQDVVTLSRNKVSDAFISSIIFAKKTIKIESEENIDDKKLLLEINNYFNKMEKMDSYASALVNNTDITVIGNEINNEVKRIMDEDGIFYGDFGEEFLDILTNTSNLLQTKYNNFDEFNIEYIKLLQKIFNLYK